VQGTAGIALVVAGIAVSALGNVWQNKAVAGDDLLARKVRDRVQRTMWLGVVAIAIAVGGYYAARSLGQGRIGIYACVAVLIASSAIVRVAILRRTADLLSAERVRPFRLGVTLQAVGYAISYAGVAVYLLRP
jgi:hypothetical protein